jgi:hypothetical protein
MGFLVKRILTPVLAKLGSRTIVTVGGTLFVLNMVIPDPLPLVDEFLILAATILMSRWAKAGEPGVSTDAIESPKHVGRGSTKP